jgi:iron(III) transport system substrate-binding protein
VKRPIPLLLVLASVVAACGGSTASDDLSEGSLVLYSGRSEELVAPLVERFETETGISVEVRYAGSGELATTLLQEGDASPADLFWSQDPAFVGAVALEDMFEPLPDDVLGRVPARFSDSQGRWVGVTARARVFVYNPGQVAAPPADIWALTEPEWAGKVGVAPTNGSFVAFVSAMVLTEGEDRTLEWLSGIAANDPVIFDGNAPIVAATDAGDIAGGLVNHYYLLRLADEQGGATAINHFFPSGDPGSLVMVSGAGLLKTAENRDEALRFLQFLVSDETQAFFLSEILEYPLVDGAGTPAGQTPLADLPTLDLDLSQLATTVDRATELIAEAGLT